MSNSVSGVVTSIEGRPVTTRFGNKTAYNIIVDGEKFAAGFKKPDCNIGDRVSFEHKGDAYRTIVGSINAGVGPAPAPGSAVSKPAAAASGGGRYDRPFPVPPLHGDRSIIRQNSVGHAVRMYEFIGPLQSGAVAGYNDHAMEIVKIARVFEAYASGDLDREAAELEVMVAKVSKVGSGD